MSLLACFKRKFLRGSRSSAGAAARTTSNNVRANTQNNDMLNTLALTTLLDADTDDRETSTILAGDTYQAKARAEAEQRGYEAMQDTRTTPSSVYDGLVGSSNNDVGSRSNYSGSSYSSGYSSSSSDSSSSSSDCGGGGGCD